MDSNFRVTNKSLLALKSLTAEQREAVKAMALFVGSETLRSFAETGGLRPIMDAAIGEQADGVGGDPSVVKEFGKHLWSEAGRLCQRAIKMADGLTDPEFHDGEMQSQFAAMEPMLSLLVAEQRERARRSELMDKLNSLRDEAQKTGLSPDMAEKVRALLDEVLGGMLTSKEVADKVLAEVEALTAKTTNNVH